MEFRINFNPYELRTEFFLDGEALSEDSRFAEMKEKRLQQWLAKNGDWGGLCYELNEQTNEAKVEILFRGRSVDYEDLKLYLDQECADKIILLEPELTKNDQDIISKLDEIIENKVLKNKDVFTTDQIKDICETYEKAKDTNFKVCVIATMSSGKSTLINALLGRDLLPSNSAACTATITTITDNDHMDRFNVKCLDQEGKQVDACENVTVEELEKFNENMNIGQIDLLGPVPGIESKKMTLCLIDTPGTNNSTNDDHEEITKAVINSDENTMVIYVMNPTNIQSDDNNELLESIAKVMQKEGKQAEDRFLFVINKCDELNPEKKNDTIERIISRTKEYLIGKGIHYPNLYPVTAEIAKLIRMEQGGAEITRQDKKDVKGWIENFEGNEHEDLEYQRLLSFETFASLPPESRENIQNRLKAARVEDDIITEALIHTGVPALEETVEEYLEKYAYPMKINDSIKDLIKIIDQEEMKCKFNKEIQEDKDKLEKVKKDIISSKEQLEKIKNRKIEIASEIESFSFSINIVEIKRSVFYELNEIALKVYSNRLEIKVGESHRIFGEFNNLQKKYLSELKKKLETEIEKEILEKGNGMLKKFRAFMDELKSGIEVGSFDFDKVVSFKDCDINDLDSVIKKHTREKTHEEKYNKRNPKKEGFWGKLKFWEPDEIEDIRTVSDGEVVNVKNVVQNALLSWHEKLEYQIDEYFENAQNRVEQFKNDFKKDMNQAEESINKTLEEISVNIENNLTMKKHEKEQEIEANHKKMIFLESVNQELNEILNF